jgi:hypothetical protein
VGAPTGGTTVGPSPAPVVEATRSHRRPVEARGSPRGASAELVVVEAGPIRGAEVMVETVVVASSGAGSTSDHLVARGPASRTGRARWVEPARWAAARERSEPIRGHREEGAPVPGLRAPHPPSYFTDPDERFPGVRSGRWLLAPVVRPVNAPVRRPPRNAPGTGGIVHATGRRRVRYRRTGNDRPHRHRGCRPETSASAARLRP